MFSKLIRTENHLPFKEYKYSYTFLQNFLFLSYIRINGDIPVIVITSRLKTH